MKNTMWIYFLIFLSELWSTKAGPNENTSMNPNSTSPPLKDHVNKKEAFKLGRNAKLTCSDKTWNETIYVIWNINLKDKTCRISISKEGENIDNCQDGKLVRNTTTSQSYLQIPNFSSKDAGVYRCETAYKGGNANYNYDVMFTVSPSISTKIEQRNKTMVAVCRAERGNPAANISWSLTGNSEPETSQSVSDGFVTVESILKLPEGMNPENLSCVIQHPSWDQDQTVQVLKVQKDFGWLWIFIPIIGVIVVFLAGGSIFALKKVKQLRRHHMEDTQNKPPRTEDVEDVEPYASYVQRVNSIYN